MVELIGSPQYAHPEEGGGHGRIGHDDMLMRSSCWGTVHCSACKGGVGCGARNDGADDEEAIDVDGMASRPARPWSCTSLDIACWAVTMVGQVMGTGGRRRRC